MEPHIHVFLFTVLLCVMLTGIFHPYLWIPDEPRETEIARETLVNNHWITPYLCGLPYLEKPPLYYDIVAAAFALTGTISPGVARTVSALFGFVMMACVFFFGYSWGGVRRAWLSTLVLITMPKFYRYSHLILLDIAVAAFCTLALVTFAYWNFWSSGYRKKYFLLCLFYLACTCVFMSKGLAALFHIVLTLTAFCLISRSWHTLREMASPLPMFLFFIPVATWIYLYYHEGGIGYLYEHFINNTIGRFFRIRFELQGVHFYNTDLGPSAPWYFYITRSFATLGPAVVILSFVLWEEVKKFIVQKQPINQNKQPEGNLFIFLLIWAILPAFLLSFSLTKCVSYIAPSYAAIAILVGYWLDKSLSQRDEKKWQGVSWFLIVIPVNIIVSLFKLDTRTYMEIIIGILSLAIPVFLFLLLKKRFNQCTFLIFAVTLCVLVIINSPTMLLKSNLLKKQCYFSFANKVWSQVDNDGLLYLYRPKDGIRGSIPFYKNRLALEIDRSEELRSILLSDQKIFVLMSIDRFKKIKENPSFENLNIKNLVLYQKYVLLSNTRGH